MKKILIVASMTFILILSVSTSMVSSRNTNLPRAEVQFGS